MAVILSVVLAPVLLLSIIQSALMFQRQVFDERSEMASAAERSAATIAARVTSAEVLLRTLIPASDGPACAAHLTDIKDRIPGYINFIRFDADGAVICSAARTPVDGARAGHPWFKGLFSGATGSVTSNPGALYATEPAILTSVRVDNAAGTAVGVLSGVITLDSLRPETADLTAPAGSEVALVDNKGQFLTVSGLEAFPQTLQAWPRNLGGAKGWARAAVWFGEDRQGRKRVFTASPLLDDKVFVLLSAPKRDVVSWAWVNPLSALGLPLLAFAIALAGVWVVTDRGVVRWIAYLQRIAAIYARGRYGVHPDAAVLAPPEIRNLALSLDAMAATIAARDRALRDSLVQKDALLREIHHRVKNNLQVISSLLNMQQRALTDLAARSAISDTRQRISALALIYRALYEGPDLREVDLRAFLEDLIAQLMTNDAGKRATVRTRLVIDRVSIDADRLAPLALFAVEAIANAKTHGFAEQGGLLDVTFHVCDDRGLLCIADSGRTGPAGAVVGEGVGRTLMLAFARQLGGKVSFEPHGTDGMATRLDFPLRLAGANAGTP